MSIFIYLFIYPLSKNLVTWTLEAISKNQSWLVLFGFTHTINLSCVSQVSPVVCHYVVYPHFWFFDFIFGWTFINTAVPFCHTDKLERNKKRWDISKTIWHQSWHSVFSRETLNIAMQPKCCCTLPKKVLFKSCRIFSIVMGLNLVKECSGICVVASVWFFTF